jgi:Skp family chaperone for outer membrane proteins
MELVRKEQEKAHKELIEKIQNDAIERRNRDEKFEKKQEEIAKELTEMKDLMKKLVDIQVKTHDEQAKCNQRILVMMANQTGSVNKEEYKRTVEAELNNEARVGTTWSNALGN